MVILETGCELKEYEEGKPLPHPKNSGPTGESFEMCCSGDGKKVPVPTQDHRIFIQRAAETFSGDVSYGRVPPGTVLVRYCQMGSVEPGQFWSELDDIALILNDIRHGLAVAPEWNQDGFLEMLVVPEDIPLSSYLGKAATQILISTEGEGGKKYVPEGKADSPGNFFLAGGTKQHFIPREELQGEKPQQRALQGCILVIPETGLRGFTTGKDKDSKGE
jgi:hypothetical protein